MRFKFLFSNKSECTPPSCPVASETGVGQNLCVYLKHRTICKTNELPFYSSASQPHLSAITAGRLPYTLSESPIQFTSYDKVFASHWINDHQIAVGTKCNKLLIVSVKDSRIIEIPFLSIQKRPSSLITDTLSTPTFPSACVGIHSIAINPSKTKMALGSGKPYEVIVYELPSMEPIAALTGHTDLVFSLDFLTDDILATASRDSTVGLFSLSSESSSYLSLGLNHPLPVYLPLNLYREHKNKVRDLKYNKQTHQVLTLGADAKLKLWDANRMDVISNVPLKYANETVCLGRDVQRQLVSIGSQTHISLLDLREMKWIHHFESVDEGWGVRSLAHNEHIMASGGGLGRLAFYDLRSLSTLPLGKDHVGYLEAHSEGYLNRDPIYMTHFHGTVVKNAIYTLSYCEDYCRLFTGGGPLQLGLCGSYMAVW